MSSTEYTIVNKLINDINNKISYIKSNFESVITDKNIPLENRWQLFLDAPAGMRNTRLYIVHFKSLPEDTIGYDMAVHVERYQTVPTEDLVVWYEESLFDSDKYADMFKAMTSSPDEYGTIKLDEEDQQKLNNLKEEILEMNLESFIYDW